MNTPWTYHGVSITIAGQTFTGLLTILGENEQTLDEVETTHHGTPSHRTFRPEDLINAGTFEVEFHFDAAQAQLDLSVAPGTITITIPIPPDSADTVPATLAGTGFLTSVASPQVEAGQTETAKHRGTVRWDGETPPVFTPQAAA